MSRAALLDIAVREFGEKGLEGASTRCIASAAGTAMSAITYHYGGKRGLYLAAAEHIAHGICETLLSDANDDMGDARGRIHAILSRFADRMLGDQSEAWALFIMREQLRPSEAFACIYDEAIGQVISVLATLIRQATGVAADMACLTASLLFGQVTALRGTRPILLRVLGCSTMGEECAIRIKRQVADNIDAILDMLTINLAVTLKVGCAHAGSTPI